MATVNRESLVRDNRRISIQIERLATEALAGHDLTAMQANMLQYILCHSDRGTSLTAIHREYGYSMAALSGMLKRLRRKGYVRVEPCDDDDRRKLLFGTEQSEALQEDLNRSMRATEQQLYDCFTPEELADLDRLQKKILRNLSALKETQGGI